MKTTSWMMAGMLIALVGVAAMPRSAAHPYNNEERSLQECLVGSTDPCQNDDERIEEVEDCVHQLTDHQFQTDQCVDE